MPKVGNQGADPHLKSPFFKYVIIIAIIAALVYFVAPKVIEIYNNNVDDTESRANNS
jgi:hypothetical protein